MCSAKLRGFVLDANRFILDYRADIEQFPLSIYSNALQCVQSGSIKEIHIPRLPASSDLQIRGTRMTRLQGHTSRVFDIDFSHDGKLLATASLDETVRLWDVATQKTLRVLKHNGRVDAIAFSRDRNLLACAENGADARYGAIKLWNTATGKELQMQSPIEGDSFVSSIAFSSDGKLLASTSDETVRIWDATTGCSLRNLPHECDALSVAFSPDGKLLASAWDDGVVKLWNPHTGDEIRSFVAHNDSIFAIACSPDGQLLASASADSTVKIWDLATGINRQTFAGHTRRVVSIAFSPDGKLISSAAFDGTIQLWESTTGKIHEKLGRLGEFASGVALSPDGSLLACAFSATGAVEIWELHGFT